MTSTSTAPRRPLAKSQVKIVTSDEVADHVQHYHTIGVEARGRSILLTNWQTGDLLPPDHLKAISGKAVEHVTIHHLVGDEEAGVKIRQQVERFGARCVVISPGAVRAWVEAKEAAVGVGDARAAYEVKAATVGLQELESFDVFRQTFSEQVKTDPLADLVERLKAQVAKPTGAAVLIVDVSGREGSHADGLIEEGKIRGTGLGENEYYITGMDPSASGLLQARADASPVGIRGDRTIVGRVDDPAEQMRDPERWGTPEQVEAEGVDFATAMAQHMQRKHGVQPPTRQEWDSDEARAAEAATEARPEVPLEPKLGEVVEATPAQLIGLELVSHRYGAPPTKVARLTSQGNTVLWQHGNTATRFTADTSMRVPIDEQAQAWAEGLVKAAADTAVGKPDVLVADVRDGILDLKALAQTLPVLVTKEQ